MCGLRRMHFGWEVGLLRNTSREGDREWKGDLHRGGALELGSRFVVGIGLRA